MNEIYGSPIANLPDDFPDDHERARHNLWLRFQRVMGIMGWAYDPMSALYSNALITALEDANSNWKSEWPQEQILAVAKGIDINFA